MAGVNESIGTESERSDEERALKIRLRPRIFRIDVMATAAKKSGPIEGKPRMADNKNSRPPPNENPIPVKSFGSSEVMYLLTMMKYVALVTAPRSARKIQSMYF
jgi:hypothetical protein